MRYIDKNNYLYNLIIHNFKDFIKSKLDLELKIFQKYKIKNWKKLNQPKTIRHSYHNLT